MKPEELRDLADDIAAYGLRDPVTLTPDGLLLDGRNRSIACEMAGVEPATAIFDGDPWLFFAQPQQAPSAYDSGPDRDGRREDGDVAAWQAEPNKSFK